MITMEELDNMTGSQLDDMLALNEEVIAGLEKDILHLQWQTSQYGPDVTSADRERPLTAEDTEEEKSLLLEEIKNHSERIKETSRLTEISIEKVEREVLHLGDEVCDKKFNVHMHVLDRQVKLECEIRESSSQVMETGISGGRLNYFNVMFEQDINVAIGEAVKKAAEELEIHSVLSLLKSFLIWDRQRHQVVEKLTHKYPHSIRQVKDGDSHFISIVHPLPGRPMFVVQWKRELSPLSLIEAKLSLQVQATEQLKASDKEGVLTSAPDMFGKMISTLGLEEAFCALVQMVVTDGRGDDGGDPVNAVTS